MLERGGHLILTSSIHAAAMADVVVTATSFPGHLIDDDLLPNGAIICDISRPRSISESIVDRRPDMLVIDGGIIALPGRTRVGPYGLEEGTSYACMAETMLLALEGRFQDTSLGSSLDICEVKRQQALARKHGFALATLQSFGRPAPRAA
jgi:predicted amino acid dehydrogenase